jgi:1-acyl-sn-glycerol-3-phosphate acyltransferase
MIRTHELLAFWRGFFGVSWPGQEMCVALAEKFLERVEVCDPKGLVALDGRPVMFLGNHQVYLESLLFNLAVSPLTRRPATTLAKSGHRDRWLGRFVELVFRYPGLPAYQPIEYFDRENADQAIGDTVRRLERIMAGGTSLMIHVEGTRRRSARRGRVIVLSPLWVGLAMSHDWPIVPVRFVGGLPAEDNGIKYDVPVDFGRQIVRVGRPIQKAELLALPAQERVPHIRAAINALQDCATERPGPADPEFGSAVSEWVARTGADPVAACIIEALRRSSQPLGPGCRVLVEAAARIRASRPARLALPPGPEGEWVARAAEFLFGRRQVDFATPVPVTPIVASGGGGR